METVVAIWLASGALFLFGLICFVIYLRTRRRWLWWIAVFAMSFGIVGISFP